MRNAAEIAKGLIRQTAQSLRQSSFASGRTVEACVSVERAGIPSSYALAETAREYDIFQSSEELAAILAGRVGNPRVSPVPPVWPVLALVLLGWRETLTAEQVINQAAKFSVVQDHVHRGLAVVAHLFPELQQWLEAVPLRIPRWEMTLAVPLAARKLIFLEKTHEPGAVSSPCPRGQTGGLVRWRVTGGTRRGASHVRSGVINQDAIQYRTSDDGTTVALAVADGHGSPLCFRSDTGAQFAVKTAVHLLHRFAETVISAISYQTRAALAELLTQSWRTAVHRHLAAHPFTEDERRQLVAHQGWDGRQILERHPELAYGSTILAVLGTPTYVLSMQLGDGDILFMYPEGSIRRAVPEDSRFVDKSTASLCWQNAAAKVRIHVHDDASEFPVLILAATDGYTQCYESGGEFRGIGRSYLRIVREEGFDGIQHRLPAVLDEASWRGGDVSIGLILRCERENVTAFETNYNVARE